MIQSVTTKDGAAEDKMPSLLGDVMQQESKQIYNWYHSKYAPSLPKAFNTYNTGFE